MKKLTAILLASLFAVMCLVPAFASPVLSVTASEIFELQALETTSAGPVYARIIDAKGDTVARIYNKEDIKLTLVESAAAPESLKQAYDELNGTDPLFDLCPGLAERYSISDCTHYCDEDLVVVSLFDVQLSQYYADLLAVEGNQIIFAVSRTVNTGIRIVGLSRGEDGWNTVTKEVNTRRGVILTNPTVGTFAFVVSRGNSASEGGLFWAKLLKVWGQIFG